jgi:hypothetical protein
LSTPNAYPIGIAATTTGAAQGLHFGHREPEKEHAWSVLRICVNRQRSRKIAGGRASHPWHGLPPSFLVELIASVEADNFDNHGPAFGSFSALSRRHSSDHWFPDGPEAHRGGWIRGRMVASIKSDQVAIATRSVLTQN